MVVPVLIGLAAAGCGSTALRSGRPLTGADSATDQGLGPQATANVGTTGSTLPGSSNTGARGADPSGSSSQVPGSRGGSPVGDPGAVSVTAPSVGPSAASKGPIRVGVTEANIAAIAAVFGKNPTQTSTTNAFIDYFNKHGGIAGRKIQPVYFTADSSDDATTSAQKACAAFTQDTRVDVVLDGVIGGDILPSCLQRQGVAEFTAGNWTTDSAALKPHPNMFQPVAMQVDRQMTALLQVSTARTVLKRGDKLGVMVEDCPYASRTYENVVVPYAKKLGITLTRSSITCLTNLVQDLVPISNDVSRAVLAFNTAGVTHVMAVDAAEAFVIANFTTTASSQHFFPKYLVTSNAYPWGNSQSDATIKINADALPNMSGVGYLPLLDVGTGATPTAAQKARQAECTAADPTQIGAATETDSGKSFKQSVFYSNCDAAWVMKATIEAAGGRLDYVDLARAFEALKQRGSTSAVLGGGRVGGPSDTLDGTGFVRPFSYDTTRKTFAYVGGAVPVS